MSSVGEVAQAVHNAAAESDEYLTIKWPAADMLDKLSRTQGALAMVLGELLEQVVECATELDKNIETHPVAARKIGEASTSLANVSTGTNNKGLLIASEELARVADDTDDFGGLLVSMSLAVCGQQNMLKEMIDQLNEAAGVTHSMSKQASEHVLQVGEASMALHMYADEITG